MATRNGPVYAVTALFDKVDDLVHAVDAVVASGYTKFDVHTPYPVHGLDRRAALRPSKMGLFAFVYGVLGALSAVTLMTWVSTTAYPLVIGGKPYWSWPAFVPVAFEVTVLLTAVLSTVTMIVLYFRFPNLSHPLHDTPYMKSVSADKYGIALQADDPKFNEREAIAFLSKHGGREVGVVTFDADELRRPRKVFEPRFLALLASVAVGAIAVTYFYLNVLLYMPPFNWMMLQPKMKAQEASALFKDGIGMRPPVEGTVARGFLPYPYKGKPEDAAKYLVNPLLPTTEVLAKGREKFLTYCSPCHGNFGAGDSRLRGQFPNPPTLHSDKVRNWPDGSIYHVITEGQNVMPSYASQISRDDRWAIIEYIRVLQRSQHAKETDLP